MQISGRVIFVRLCKSLDNVFPDAIFEVVYFSEISMMGTVRGTVLDQEWYKSREGNGLLASLTNPTTGHRKL